MRRYFQSVGARKDLGEAEFCKWLTREIGVAAIPMSAFMATRLTKMSSDFVLQKRRHLECGHRKIGQTLIVIFWRQVWKQHGVEAKLREITHTLGNKIPTK